MDAEEPTPPSGEKLTAEQQTNQQKQVRDETVVEQRSEAVTRGDCGSTAVGGSFAEIQTHFDECEIEVKGWYTDEEKNEDMWGSGRQGVVLKLVTTESADEATVLTEISAGKARELSARLEEAAAVAAGDLDEDA